MKSIGCSYQQQGQGRMEETKTPSKTTEVGMKPGGCHKVTQVHAVTLLHHVYLVHSLGAIGPWIQKSSLQPQKFCS
jgi:hypothetical protein